ncbi:ATP synthase F1 subunit delta [uncultured Buchnera sp.]|jgi:F-type H+-transporting ATPase subunit delta|uniref:ATP synthase F1 subunit delta n=1 Tax=uncultured Buchnera sp. TaxID=574037 RepID=UPI0025D8D4D2|nr:ATP synthase F1 subunit delta [uncultured Buchnera sp.]
MSVFDTIARPYAKAIFALAIENKSIEKWKKMLIFIDEIVSSKKIEKFLSGSLSPCYLSSFFIFVAGDKIDEKARNLIKLLAKNQRFKIFNNILQKFLKLETSYRGNMIVELTSAYSLKENEIIDIRYILQKIFLYKIKFIYKIDHQILDGIIIKTNDTVFDFSIRSRLKQLSEVLNF